MIKNYLKIAWRNILRQRGYAGINIIGLAIGIAACILILQYVSFELSYENFHVKKNRIYRVQLDRYNNGELSTQWAAGAYAVGNSFKDAIPEIEEYVKVRQNDPVVIEVNNQPIKINKVFFATNSFFSVFTYPIISGDKEKPLTELFTAAISETTARILYGTDDAVGKRLTLNRRRDYTITAVFKDPPVNTQLRPDILLSYPSFIKIVGPNNDPETSWFWDGCLTYLLLRKDADPKVVEKKFVPVVEKFTAEEMKQSNTGVRYYLESLRDIHLYSHFIGEPAPNGDGKTVYLLLVIAFFIAVIAWVNYINLATARAINRAKEVGIRKTVGSQRRQLIIQFLSESALLNAFALILAIVMVIIAIPGFNKLSGLELSFSVFSKQGFWLGLAGLFFIGVFFSGLYPAFVLSGFRPIEVLKGKMTATTKGVLLRKGLVVFQFTASLFLLIGTLAVYKQIQYMRKQSLGINIDQTLVVRPPGVIDSKYVQNISAFKEALNQQTGIKGVAISSSIPGQPVAFNAGGIRLVGADESASKQYRVIEMDHDYMKQYGIKLIAGRYFSKEFGSDDSAVIFNKKGFEQLGLNKPEEAIGKRIDFWGNQYTIVGVTENFHQQSLREAFEPLFFVLDQDFIGGYLSVKTPASNASETIAFVKSNWNKFFPGNTFEYFFLDDHFDKQYKADQRFGQVFGLFTLLAIFVACLGLFGLASFTTIQRTKEIGIRKVLGASVIRILRLLYKDFAILLLIAFAVTVPLSWIAIGNWLEGYPFRIKIHWSFFLIPFATILLVALLTVSFQSIKAAIANPVKSLRTE
jgi:putative ABC transport system permease protein